MSCNTKYVLITCFLSEWFFLLCLQASNVVISYGGLLEAELKTKYNMAHLVQGWNKLPVVDDCYVYHLTDCPSVDEGELWREV